MFLYLFKCLSLYSYIRVWYMHAHHSNRSLSRAVAVALSATDRVLVCVCVWSYAFAEDVSLSPSIGSLLCVVAAVADDGGGGIVGCVSVSVSYRLINNLVFILSGALAAAMVTCLSHFTAFSIFRITCPTIFCTIYRYIHIYIYYTYVN